MRTELFLLLFLSPLPVMANPFVPDAELWQFWSAHTPGSAVSVDHSDWQALLDRYLDSAHPSGINRFAYADVSDEDRLKLQAYIESLTSTDPRQLDRAEQFAYWVNLYNAFTVELILEHYPVKTIRRIYGGLLRLGPWNREVFEIEGQALSLNDVEHRILRPIWQDARIHYAVNCASLGCPNLAAEAFTAGNTERLLEQASRDYVNHSRGVRFDGDRLELSSIYDWYQADFGDDRRALLGHLARYAEPPLADRLTRFDGRLGFDYDWALNEP